MKNLLIVLLLVTLIVVNQSLEQAETIAKRAAVSTNVVTRRCQRPKNGRHLCLCGINRLIYDRLRGEICRGGQIVRQGSQKLSTMDGLRSVASTIRRSTREEKTIGGCMVLRVKGSQAFVPLRNVSVEAWIHTFAADVTLTQVFVNREENPIEAIYAFPIEENAAIYGFTAEIDDRLITAVLKEKKVAEAEYDKAVQQGQTAVLLRQSEKTLDTFRINVGALPPGKECIVKIRYVTELDLIDGNFIRFVVPTTVAPRYNPDLGSIQSPDGTTAEYVQNTPYSISFRAHIERGEQNKIMQVANLSHPVNVSLSGSTIDVSLEGAALDRDIILDIDLPDSRSSMLVAVEQYDNSTQHAILTALNPRLSDFVSIFDEKNDTTTATEFIFIVDCSGSMESENKIALARQAMLLFVRSLPVGSHFNIIRFGSHYKLLFNNNEMMTTVYDEKTAKQAEILSRSMEADLGGTELLEPLQYLKKHPPVEGRSRQVFLLTDGEISNTDLVIELCRSMSSTTRIFSFGLGHSPSRALVKGLARATNGHFVFVPPSSKVDTYVGSQLRRALQPSIADARLEWHGLSSNGSQSPRTIPVVYPNDRVLVYTLLESADIDRQTAQVDFFVGKNKMSTAKFTNDIARKGDTIRRLAAKALIQELQHAGTEENAGDMKLEQRITKLSLTHQILSPYTAFVGVETTRTKYYGIPPKVRHVPIQISKGDEHLFAPLPAFAHRQPQALMSYSSHNLGYRGGGGAGLGPPPMSMNSWGFSGPLYGQRQQSSQYNRLVDLSLMDQDSFESVSTTTMSSSAMSDPVRWLIEQQSFNGAWTLSDHQVQQLTKGQSWDAFKSTISKDKDVITTALAIAMLELKYADQQSLWFMVVEKGRKRLLNFGLSKDKVDSLIKEIKNKL